LGVAIGAAAMGLLPGSFSKQLPREQGAVAKTMRREEPEVNDGQGLVAS
jgi:hypothetical protein